MGFKQNYWEIINECIVEQVKQSIQCPHFDNQGAIPFTLSVFHLYAH